MTEALRLEAVEWARRLWGDVDPRYRDLPPRFTLILRTPTDRADWDRRREEYTVVQRALARVGEYVPPPSKPWPTVLDEAHIVVDGLERAVEVARFLIREMPPTVISAVGIGYGPIVESGVSDDGTVTRDGPGWWAARGAADSATQNVVHLGFPSIVAAVPPSLEARARELIRAHPE